eukprot:Sdes_comp19671_c0_seq1m11530
MTFSIDESPDPAVSNTIYDVGIVGGGLMGSCAAYRCAKENLSVLLMEQYDFLHRIGSSHGESRIIRRTYPEDFYSKWMEMAYPLWREIEQESGAQLLTTTGGLDMGHRDCKVLESIMTSANKNGIPFELLTAQEIHSRFPGVRVPSDFIGIYQKDAGVLNATKCVAVIQGLARKHGAILLDKTPVVDFYSRPDSVEKREIIHVVTLKGTFLCRKLLIVPGAWGNRLLAKSDVHLKLCPLKVTVGYYPTSAPIYRSPHFPVFIFYNSLDPDKSLYNSTVGIYGLPCSEYPDCIKIASHSGPQVDLDARDFSPDSSSIAEVRQCIKSFFPFVSDSAAFYDTCMYSNTVDNDFIIDYHPLNPNIVIAAGFSGHGFKFGPLIGDLVYNLLLNQSNPYSCEMHHFKISRFHNSFKDSPSFH